jgi:hypothetical protein
MTVNEKPEISEKRDGKALGGFVSTGVASAKFV